MAKESRAPAAASLGSAVEKAIGDSAAVFVSRLLIRRLKLSLLGVDVASSCASNRGVARQPATVLKAQAR